MPNKRLIFVVTFMLFVGAACLLAKNAGWHAKEKPSVSLVEAHQIALAALKDRHIDYYCLGASVARTFSSCDWELHFSSAGGAETWVSVDDHREARISDHGFEY